MTKRRISFNPEMLDAIKQGRKTQARRMRGLDEINEEPERWEFVGFTVTLNRSQRPDGTPQWVDDAGRLVAVFRRDDGYSVSIPCPHGAPSDVMELCEPWCRSPITSDACLIADYTGEIQGWRRHPAFTMPSRLARHHREVINILIERLGDISEADALAEGVPVEYPALNPREEFILLWERVYGFGAWLDDWRKWCWVVEFGKEEVAP